MKKEELENLKKIISKEITLERVCKAMNLSELEILGMISQLKHDGDNILVSKKNDSVYIMDYGDDFIENEHNYYINTSADEIRLGFISDTRLCSRFQQLSILNDIYKKANDMGITDIIHCGDISEGVYPSSSLYNDTIFLHDVTSQSDYIVDNYPYISGLNTHFILGEHDLTHLKKEKADIGKLISSKRNDMNYLAKKRQKIVFRNELGKEMFSILVLHPSGKIPYTISYKPQQFISSMRSEDKTDILLHGHWLQTEHLNFREINEFSVPSVVATTPEMTDRGDQNTIGAWFVTIKLKNNKIEKISPLFLPYYKAITDDYKKAKVLKLGGM